MIRLVQPVCGWCREHPCRCLRTAPCACGGVVIGRSVEAMQDHQATDLHAAWRVRMGL